MTSPNGDLAAQVRGARRLLAEYRTGAGNDRDWAPRLAGVLGIMLIHLDTVPADVDQAARDAMPLAQALGEIAAVNPFAGRLARLWLTGELPHVFADHVVDALGTLPDTVSAARRVVVDTVRAREARHAASGSDGDR